MNVFILNTLETGVDLVEYLRTEIAISGIIYLKESDKIDPTRVSGYQSQHLYCDTHGIPAIEVDTYNLSSEKDKRVLQKLQIDILIVSGWQRLIPEWLISHASICIGGHGSPFGITEGRGRSPQNWAFILGRNTFYLSIFKIDSEIDSGAVIDTATFEYNPYDTIRTSYKKVTLLMGEMVSKNIKNGTIWNVQKAQPKAGLYFPQRTPEDGGIDWNQSSETIYNCIRALTTPYPGAFTFLGESKLTIWKAQPFDTESVAPAGTVNFVFTDGTFLVQTLNGRLLVTEYSPSICIHKNDVFRSVDKQAQLNQILDRHSKKYPHLKINPKIYQ